MSEQKVPTIEEAIREAAVSIRDGFNDVILTPIIERKISNALSAPLDRVRKALELSDRSLRQETRNSRYCVCSAKFGPCRLHGEVFDETTASLALLPKVQP